MALAPGELHYCKSPDREGRPVGAAADALVALDCSLLMDVTDPTLGEAIVRAFQASTGLPAWRCVLLHSARAIRPLRAWVQERLTASAVPLIVLNTYLDLPEEEELYSLVKGSMAFVYMKADDERPASLRVLAGPHVHYCLPGSPDEFRQALLAAILTAAQSVPEEDAPLWASHPVVQEVPFMRVIERATRIHWVDTKGVLHRRDVPSSEGE